MTFVRDHSIRLFAHLNYKKQNHTGIIENFKSQLKKKKINYLGIGDKNK